MAALGTQRYLRDETSPTSTTDIHRPGSIRRTALIAAMGLLAACSDATQLVVVVDSNLPFPGVLESVEVTTTDGADAVTFQRSFDLSRQPLPISFGVLAGRGDEPRMGVRIVGLLADGRSVEQTAQTGFVRGDQRLLRLFIDGRCVGVTCDSGQTCRLAGGCESEQIPVADLPPVEPGDELLDAGVVVGRDGGVAVDAGPVEQAEPCAMYRNTGRPKGAWTENGAFTCRFGTPALASDGAHLYMVGGSWTEEQRASPLVLTLSPGIDADFSLRRAWLGAPPVPRGHPAATTIGELLLIVGGSGRADDTALIGRLDASGTVTDWGTPVSLPSQTNDVAWDGVALAADAQTIVVAGGGGQLECRSDVLVADRPGGVQDLSFRAGPPLPAPRCGAHAAIVGDFVYVVGGRADGGLMPLSSVLRSALADGANGRGPVGPWVEDAPLPGGRAEHALVIHERTLIVLGGTAMMGRTDTVLTSSVGTDGALGPWRMRTSLPGLTAEAGAAVLNDRIHLTGNRQAPPDLISIPVTGL